MKRIIYSLYIDIPDEQLDYQPPYPGDTLSKTERTKLLFQEHSPWLIEKQKAYAESIGVDYKVFMEDSKYLEFSEKMRQTYPQITGYNVVNFYKIQLMYDLAKEYDEILYLDLDVVPVTSANFFEVWDLSKGVAIKSNKNRVNHNLEKILMTPERRDSFGKKSSNRSPTAKFWNQRAMVLYDGIDGDYTHVFNTGIVGINREHLEKLDYFGNFNYTIELMDELKADEDIWPHYIRDMFGWDNETIWGYKTMENNVPCQWLNESWHMFFDKEIYIDTNTKLIHCVNKRFEYVKKWCEENNL
mgnify:CR=1 FL=1